MQTGVDAMVAEAFARIRGRSVALLCNQASLTSDVRLSFDAFHAAHQSGVFNLEAVFGPQHGLWGHTQDNMIEWEGGTDARTGLTVYSLYGEHREPTQESLDGVDLFVVDLPDIGARAYTFVWTMVLCMKACEQAGVPILVLDRPNPIGGTRVEGPLLDPEYASFIGLHPLPLRHGLTIGEVARHLRAEHYPKADLSVVPVEGWVPAACGDEPGLLWAMPSPNMPSVDTEVVYPGMCLLEGTNLSEGRGTTRPFEMFGAPFIDGWDLAAALNALDLPGVRYRPVVFEPTFDKHAGTACGGCAVHVLDRDAYEPVLSGIAVLQAVKRLYPDAFEWKQPPFEYDETHMPIDILAGTNWVREAVDAFTPLMEIRGRLLSDAAAFASMREAAILYSR
ncbi:MAG TPA: DUF1343 domain-containing protein [Armatimonadota bacterium]